MHSRFDSWSNIHLLSIIEAFLSGAVRMSLVWISKAVVSHIDEEAMLQSVFYNIVIAILLVTVVGSTHLHVVCHHLSTDGSLKGPAPPRHPPHPLISRSALLPPLLIWRSGSATVICLMLLFLGQVTCQNFTLTWPHYIQYFLPINYYYCYDYNSYSASLQDHEILASSTELFMLFSQMTCSHNTFALSPCSERLEHANITQLHCLSLSVKNKSICSTFL